MSAYRFTEFTSPDLNKVFKFSGILREDIAADGAEFIDIVALGDDRGLVIAKYSNQAIMEAPTDINQAAFGKMIAAGIINRDSISGRFGAVDFTF